MSSTDIALTPCLGFLQALFRRAQLKALVGIHSQAEGGACLWLSLAVQCISPKHLIHVLKPILLMAFPTAVAG